MNQVYTLEQLGSICRAQLWDICRTNGLKCYPKTADCVEAIWNKQQSVEKVAVAEIKADEQATAQTELETHIVSQAETIAPEITTVEISFYDHEIYAAGKQIAAITHDPDDFQTQRWVVMVGETEVHRADAWAKCHSYITWHYKQGTLPVAIEAQVEVHSAIPGYDFCSSQGIEFKQRTGSETGAVYWYAEANHYYNQLGRSYHSTSFPRLENAVKAAVDYLGKCGVDVVEVKQQIIDCLKADFNAHFAGSETPAKMLAENATAVDETPIVQSGSLTPEIEVDSVVDPDFGVLYRVWNSRTLLGTFYQSADGKWIAQPCNSEERPRCNTATVAQLIIVAMAGLLVADTADETVDLLDKPEDELTVAEWEFVKQQAMQSELAAA